MDNGGAAIASVGADRRPSSSSTGSGASSKKRHHRNFSKGLVDYTSEVSSEEFSGPEDGEVDSDGGRGRPPSSPPSPAPAIKPGLVANASPIDDEDIDLGKYFGDGRLNLQKVQCWRLYVESVVFLDTW